MPTKETLKKMANDNPALRAKIIPVLKKKAESGTDGMFKADKFEKTLSAEVSRIIGKKVSLTVTLDRKGLQVTSPDLADTLGIKLFKSLHIETFNRSINVKPDSEFRYWLTLSYRWTNFTGGTNGTEIGAFYMDADGKIVGARADIK